MSDSNTSPSLTLWSVDASSETEDLSTEYDPPSSPRHTSNKSMDSLITFKRMSDSNTTPSFTLRKQLVDDSSDSSDEPEDLSTEYDPPSSPRQISTDSISPPFLLKRPLHSKILPRSQRTVTNWSDFLVRTRSSSSYESGKSSSDSGAPSSISFKSDRSMDRPITFKWMSDSNTSPSFTLRKQLVDDSSDSSDEPEDLSTEYDPPSSPRQISTDSISPPFLLKRPLYPEISPRSQRTVTKWSGIPARTRSTPCGNLSTEYDPPSNISSTRHQSMDSLITFKRPLYPEISPRSQRTVTNLLGVPARTRSTSSYKSEISRESLKIVKPSMCFFTHVKMS